MHIVEQIRFHGDPEKLEAMVTELTVSGDLDQIRRQEGCIYFDFFRSVERKDELLLAEKWKSAQALSDHHQTEMMEHLRSLLQKYDFQLQAEKYEVPAQS